MSNAYFNASGNPATGARGLSALVRAEFAAIQAAFDLLPLFTGNANKVVVVNSGGTALTILPGTLVLAGDFVTTGAFNTTFAQTASVTLTLPSANGTLALLASPAFTGTPTAPTAVSGTNTTQLATTAFTTAAVLVETNRATAAETLLAPKASPALTGVPTAPTAAPGNNTTQLATTAFVTAATSAVVSGVSSVAGKTGVVTLVPADVVGAAPLASPALTGTPTAPTAAPGTNTTQVATTAFDTAAVLVETNRAAAAEALLAPLASPALTGTPTSPTAATGTSTTQIATTAFVRTGTTTNDNAAAGKVGEYVTGSGAGTALTTATATNIASFSLTAGDWDVGANVYFTCTTVTGVTTSAGWVSSTSATLPSLPALGVFQLDIAVSNTNATLNMPTGIRRFSLSGTTTIFVGARCDFGSGAVSANAVYHARRVR